MLKEYERSGWSWTMETTRFTIVARRIDNTKYGCPGYEYLAMDSKTGEIHRFIARGYDTCRGYAHEIIASLKAREEL